jgi:hypothetical protein
MGIFAASAVWTTTRWRHWLVVAACSALFLGSAGFAGIAFYQNCAPEDSVLFRVGAFVTGRGSEGTDEYAPPTADDSLVATNLPAACLAPNPAVPLGTGDPDMTPEWTPEQGSCIATYRFDSTPGLNDPLHKRVQAVATQAGYLILRLREYPAWSVHVNGNPMPNRPVRQDGLMAIPIPAGPADITVDWTDTPDVRAGRWISLLAILLVTALGLLTRRRAQPKLK